MPAGSAVIGDGHRGHVPAASTARYLGWEGREGRGGSSGLPQALPENAGGSGAPRIPRAQGQGAGVWWMQWALGAGVHQLEAVPPAADRSPTLAWVSSDDTVDSTHGPGQLWGLCPTAGVGSPHTGCDHSSARPGAAHQTRKAQCRWGIPPLPVPHTLPAPLQLTGPWHQLDLRPPVQAYCLESWHPGGA